MIYYQSSTKSKVTFCTCPKMNKVGKKKKKASQLKCSICCKDYNSQDMLTKHMKEFHHQKVLSMLPTPVAPPPTITPITLQNPLQCCGNVFASTKALEKHAVDKHALSWSMKTNDGLGYVGILSIVLISSQERRRGSSHVLSLSWLSSFPWLHSKE